MTPGEARKLWIAALRSDEYEQGKFVLHARNSNGDKFCCLGVACDLARKNGVELNVSVRQMDGEDIVLYDGKEAFLPDKVQTWLGVYSNNGEYDADNSLAALNDGGAWFEYIANVIERKFGT